MDRSEEPPERPRAVQKRKRIGSADEVASPHADPDVSQGPQTRSQTDFGDNNHFHHGSFFGNTISGNPTINLNYNPKAAATAAAQTYGTTSSVESRRETLIAALDFPDRGLRDAQLGKADPMTCDWIFDPQRETSNGPRSKVSLPFTGWLEGDDGLFWIYGKPGSGKSMLMKHLTRSERTVKYLTVWTGAKPVQLLTHFFFRPGSPDQSSIMGFLRNIMHQLLSLHPPLVDSVQSFHNGYFGRHWSTEDWTKELKIIANLISTHVCIFIDGIDECICTEQEEDELLGLVRDLSLCPRIKICISGRPKVLYHKTFGSHPSIKIQDFTLADFEQTALRRLQGNNRRFDEYIERVPARSERFIHDLCRRADGVYLWLHLAAEEIAKGVKIDEELAELEDRLNCLDSSLDGLFEQLMERADKFHGPSLEQLLAPLLTFPERLDFLEYSMWTLNSTLASQICNASTPQDVPDLDTEFRKLQRFERSLPERSAGLIEIVPIVNSLCNHDRFTECRTFQEHSLSARTCFIEHFRNIRPYFIHRSAADFITNRGYKKAQSFNERGLILLSDQLALFSYLEMAYTRASHVLGSPHLIEKCTASTFNDLDMAQMVKSNHLESPLSTDTERSHAWHCRLYDREIHLQCSRISHAFEDGPRNVSFSQELLSIARNYTHLILNVHSSAIWGGTVDTLPIRTRWCQFILQQQDNDYQDLLLNIVVTNYITELSFMRFDVLRSWICRLRLDPGFRPSLLNDSKPNIKFETNASSIKFWVDVICPALEANWADTTNQAVARDIAARVVDCEYGRKVLIIRLRSKKKDGSIWILFTPRFFLEQIWASVSPIKGFLLDALSERNASNYCGLFATLSCTIPKSKCSAFEEDLRVSAMEDIREHIKHRQTRREPERGPQPRRLVKLVEMDHFDVPDCDVSKFQTLQGFYRHSPTSRLKIERSFGDRQVLVSGRVIALYGDASEILEHQDE